MGTQQILLIVLSVIIVGVAVAVGITMFNQQAINAARQATIMDMNNFAATAIGWYRTPTSQGGAGQADPMTADLLDDLGAYLGFEFDGADWTFENDNAVYTLGNEDLEIQFDANTKETGITEADDPALDLDLEDSSIIAHPTGRPTSE